MQQTPTLHASVDHELLWPIHATNTFSPCDQVVYNTYIVCQVYTNSISPDEWFFYNVNKVENYLSFQCFLFLSFFLSFGFFPLPSNCVLLPFSLTAKAPSITFSYLIALFCSFACKALNNSVGVILVKFLESLRDDILDSNLPSKLTKTFFMILLSEIFSPSGFILLTTFMSLSLYSFRLSDSFIFKISYSLFRFSTYIYLVLSLPKNSSFSTSHACFDNL